MPGQASGGYFSRIEVPRVHTDRYTISPWGQNLTIQSVGTIKHTQSYKIMADAISAYVRGSTFLPSIPPIPVVTVDGSDSGTLQAKVRSFSYFGGAYIDLSNVCRRGRLDVILDPGRERPCSDSRSLKHPTF